MQCFRKMRDSGDSELASRLVALYEQRATAEFCQIAKLIDQDEPMRISAREGLIRMAKAEQSFHDLRTRTSAVKVIDILGFAKSLEVRHDLFLMFTSAFGREKLASLAAFEGLPKTKQCGVRCSEMSLLKSLLRSLLRVKEEPGLTAGRQVIEVFEGTDFARKVARWLTADTQSGSEQGDL